MNNNDQYVLKLLYGLAGNQQYRTSPSHVVPSSVFKLDFPDQPAKKFAPSAIPQHNK